MLPAQSAVGSRPLTLAAVAALCLLFAGWWAFLGVRIHRAFHSNGWDLGVVDQVIWNTAHGRWFEYSFRDISFAGDHWQPFLLAFVPLKWWTEGPEPLLVLQGIALAAAAVPLFLATRRLAGDIPALALATAWLISLAAARAASFDFHPETFSPLFAFIALLSLATGQRWSFVASCLLILTIKEDGALLALSLCWLAWFAFSWRRVPLAVAGVSLVYGAIATAIIIPHYRGDDLNPFAERYGYLGDGVFEVLVAIVVHPGRVIEHLATVDKLEATLLVLACTAFLPLLKPKLLPPLALVTLLPLLSQDEAQGSLELHYLLVPAVVSFLVAAVALRDRPWEWLAQRMPRAEHWATYGIPVALVALPLVIYGWKSPLPPSFEFDPKRFDVDHHARVSADFVALIPDGHTVSAQSAFVAHLAEREDIYQFPRVLDAKWVLVDENGPIPSDDLDAGYYSCLAALPELGFDPVRTDDGITLWEKTRESESVPEVPESCSGQHPED